MIKNNQCKFPVTMNENRKKFLKTLRNYHRGFTTLIYNNTCNIIYNIK